MRWLSFFLIFLLGFMFVPPFIPSVKANPDEITYDGTKVVVLGYSEGSECDTDDLYTADISGSINLLHNQTATQNMFDTSWGEDVQVDPADSLALKLTIEISQYSAEGYVNITGTDKDGNAQTEKDIHVTGNGNLTTSKWWKIIIDPNGVDANGTYHIAIHQERWGIFWDKAECFFSEAELEIGDGSTESWFAETKETIIFDSSVAYPIEVKNKGHLRFGEVMDSVNKLGKNGVTFINEAGTNPIKVDNGGEIELYNSMILPTGGLKRFLVAGNLTMWGTNCHSTIWTTSTSNLDIYNSHSWGTQVGLFASFSTATFNTIYVYDNSYGVRIQAGYIADYVGCVFKNNTKLGYFLGGGPANFTNCEVDSWNLQFGADTYVYRKYTYDLTVRFPNGTAIENANITITHYGQAQSQDYNGLTDSNGQIPQQPLSKGFYNQTGGNTIYSYEPYNLRISNVTGYDDYNGNFTLSEKTDWTITLTEETGGEGGYLYFAPAFLLAFLIGLALMIVWIKK